MRRAAGALLALVVVAAGTAQERRIDDGRPWLEPGSEPSSGADPILRGSAATALNDPAAEALLQGVIRSRPGSDAASQAYELLSRIYLRTGQYARAIANLDAWAKAFPGRAEVTTERADIEQFRGLPDQVNGSRRESALRHETGDFAVPITINGKGATYVLDTGAWISIITEAEAKRLGLAIRTASVAVGDSSGKGAKGRTAIAPEVALGAMRFRNLSFVVLPNEGPWASMPPGRGGILGVPVILGLGRVEWSAAGTWNLAGRAEAAHPAERNLVFSGNHLLVAASVSDTRVFATLDTGAETTDLNSNFAEAFAALVEKQGVRGAHDITGLGGTQSLDAVTLPEVIFGIGSARAPLRPAHVTMQRIGGIGGACCIGNLGLDVLTETGALTIDLSAMILHLR